MHIYDVKGGNRTFAAVRGKVRYAERLCENSDSVFVSCRSFFEIGKLVAQLDQSARKGGG